MLRMRQYASKCIKMHAELCRLFVHEIMKDEVLHLNDLNSLFKINSSMWETLYYLVSYLL